MNVTNDDSIMFLPVSETCSLLPAWVFPHSRYQPCCAASFLKCNSMGQFQAPRMCLLCWVLLVWRPQWIPQDHLWGQPITDQCFQEFCLPQQRGDSGDVTDAAPAGSRCCGCSKAPVEGISLKPPRCQPAWHSSICPAWAPQLELVAFQPFSFLPSTAVPLTSVLYSDTCETKL